jgi:hypothetical protein
VLESLFNLKPVVIPFAFQNSEDQDVRSIVLALVLCECEMSSGKYSDLRRMK